MSTKIYNAYFTTAGIGVVMDSLLRARIELHQTNRLSRREELAGIAKELGKAEALDHAREAIYSILSGMAAWNPSCSASVYAYPYPDEHNKRSSVIVQLHGMEQTEQKKLVRSFRGKDYHYQNQTDKPDDVTEAQWRAREQVWKKLLPGAGIPAENALGFDIISPREAVEHLLVALRLVMPPPPAEQFPDRGKPWEQWGPQRFAFLKAHDLERVAKTGKRAFLAEWNKRVIRLLNSDAAEKSFQSASL